MQTVSTKRLRSLLRAFCNQRILVLGDAILDQYLWGSASRISPEAPVPIVEVNRETFVPGGAANVARNITSLSGQADLIAAMGDDAMGQKLRGLLRDQRVGTEGCVADPQRPTTVKTRVVAHKQQMLRFDREQCTALNGDLSKQVVSRLAEELERASAVVIVDYDKGFVTQHVFDVTMRLARRLGKAVVVDPKPTHSLRMKGMTAIKPNRGEAYRYAGVTPDQPLERVGKLLLRKWRPDYLLISLGDEGLALFQQGKQPFRVPMISRDVSDVSGAGDTVVATFTLALAAGANSVEAALIANHAAGVVVGKVGTATVSPEELTASFEAER